MSSSAKTVRYLDPAEALDLAAIDGRVHNGLRVLSEGNQALVAPTYLVEPLCLVELAPVYGLVPPSADLESLAPLALFPVVAVNVSLRYLVGSTPRGATVGASLIAAMRKAVIARRARSFASDGVASWREKQFSESLALGVVESCEALDEITSPRVNPSVFADVALATVRAAHCAPERGLKDLRALSACLERQPVNMGPAHGADRKASRSASPRDVLDLLEQFRELWS